MNKNHECKHCGRFFETGQKLGAHIAFVHKRNQKAISKALTQKRIIVKRICKKCGTEFEVERIVNKNGEIKSGGRQFCSRSCSNARSFTLEQNKKKGGNRQKTYYDLVCKECKTPFTSRRKKQNFCNRSCASTYKSKQQHNKSRWLKICSKATSHKTLKGVIGIRKDICNKTKFKSSWEADFARILNFENLKWEYEPQTFTLEDGRNYTPDFRVNGNIYIEIKNFLQEKDINRHELFAKNNRNFYLICGYQIFYGLISLYMDNINFECKQKAVIKIQKKDIYIDAAKKIISILKENNGNLRLYKV